MAMPVQLEVNGALGPLDRALQHSLVAAASVMNRGAFKLVTGAVRKLSSSGAQTIVRLAPDTLFSFPLGDNYWSKAVFLRGDYEPELRQLLMAVRDVPYLFLDCGANYGYWSVQVTGKPFGAHRALAIEAAESNLPQLEANLRLNGSRFEVLHRAVYSSSGAVLELYGKHHFGLTVAPGDSAKRATLQQFKVETITLDDATARLDPAGSSPIIVKLDVEGAEADALAGAAALLKRDVLFLYEDERADPSNGISRHLMQDLGLAVSAIWPDRPPTEISEMADVTAAKQQGVFNFAAIPRSSSWNATLRELSRFRQGKA
jgi:FkbM family methyltransferase